MKWEYLFTNEEENISRLGGEGWELVTVIPHITGLTFYLKRPVRSFVDRLTREQKEEVYKQNFGQEESRKTSLL
ncbi:hypothetical protein V7087_13170 [Neobacillus niacini]|jgi:hypothetical protein|uniref:hypothetical protein n=1 Tax=Neobacillus niacini TaxID=86668 RepID=UPI00300090F5